MKIPKVKTQLGFQSYHVTNTDTKKPKELLKHENLIKTKEGEVWKKGDLQKIFWG